MGAIFLLIVGIAAGAIAAVFIVSLVVSMVRSRRANQVLAERRRSRNFAYELLCAGLGGRYVLKNLRIPCGVRPDGRKAYANVPLVLINRGGVSIIDVRNEVGHIDNPLRGEWTLTYGNEQQTFRNPFEANAQKGRVVEHLLKKENLYNVPISNIVLYTQPGVKFRNGRYQNLLTADRIVPYMLDLGKNRFMTLHEMEKTLKTLSAFRVKGAPVRRGAPTPAAAARQNAQPGANN